MIPIVPVVLLVPAVLVFVPPPMILAPAAFPSLAQFVPLMVRLTAVAPVAFDRLMQFVLCVLDAPLASFVDLLPRLRHCSRSRR